MEELWKVSGAQIRPRWNPRASSWNAITFFLSLHSNVFMDHVYVIWHLLKYYKIIKLYLHQNKQKRYKLMISLDEVLGSHRLYPVLRSWTLPKNYILKIVYSGDAISNYSISLPSLRFPSSLLQLEYIVWLNWLSMIQMT